MDLLYPFILFLSTGIKTILTFLIYTIDDKPTISELIRLLAEVYRLKLYKKFFDIDNLDLD